MEASVSLDLQDPRVHQAREEWWEQTESVVFPAIMGFPELSGRRAIQECKDLQEGGELLGEMVPMAAQESRELLV